MANESVRKGMSKSKQADEVFYFTDYLSVLHTYKVLKEESEEIPGLLPKMDLTEIAEPHYEAMDDFMYGILEQFSSVDPAQKDPLVAMLSGEVNMFGFIMHDPLLKKAIGNTAIDVLIRDGKLTEEDAYNEAKDKLPDLLGQFETFLNNLAGMIYKQVTPVLGKHGIHIKDATKMLSPKIERIKEFRDGIGMLIHFERPDTSSSKLDTSTKEYDTNLDSMYG
jgi:hypothetical protein